MRNFGGTDELVAMLRRLLSSRDSELVQRKDLRNAFHDLEAELKGGSRNRASRKRVTKYVTVIAKALCEEVQRGK